MSKIICCVFPGQGSQYLNMGLSTLKDFPMFSSILDEASTALHEDIVSIISSSEDNLKLTYNAQPALLTISYLFFSILKKELDIKPNIVAGHSLGEYSALCASSRLDFKDAIYLVRQRGRFMQEAVPNGVGGMGAILSFADTDIDSLCKQCSSSTEIVTVANYNSNQQIVVSGHIPALNRLQDKLANLGIKYVPLNVSAPFHSKLMEPAKQKMQPLLEQTTFKDSDISIIPNLTGKIVDTYSKEFLINQIDSSVLWTQTMETINSSSKDSSLIYIEVGPSKVLSGLAKRSFPKTVKIISTDNLVSSIKDLETLI